MKRTALLTGALCAFCLGASAQSTVVIPAFENRFGNIHQPVVVLNPAPAAGFQTRAFGGSTVITTDPASRGVVTSPFRTPLSASGMNIPVFPGDTVLLQQQAVPVFGPVVGTFGPNVLGNPGVFSNPGVFTVNPFGVTGFPANAGFGGTGVFIQQGGGTTLREVDPSRTTATPGPAVNAVPNPAAPVTTIPQIQPTTSTTIPVQQQNPTVLVPSVVFPGQVVPGAAQSQGQQQQRPPAAPQQQTKPNGPTQPKR